MTQTIDHVALLPAYLAAATAVAALLTDLSVARRRATLTVTAVGAATVAVAAGAVGTGPVRETFCLTDGGCSYLAEPVSALLAVLFALLTLGVLGLSGRAAGELPAGEFCFLLAASMTGGVVLAYSRDLITLLVALETLTLPLYALVALRRRSRASAQGAITLFVGSVVSTAVTFLGAALLYSATGVVHLDALAARLADGVPDQLVPLARAGAVLVLSGLVFKLAAVPFHAWAPPAYDGAPLPVAAYLSTASKLGGVVALVYVVGTGLRPWLEVVGPVLAGLAVLTMTTGNLLALRQRRMVRLLSWSSVAQAGYLLVPLGGFAMAAGRTDDAVTMVLTATLVYAIFYVTIELAAFAAVVAFRGGRPDGGAVSDYRGLARGAPLVGGALAFALVGLAGLPPALAGMFAKVAVVRAVVAADAWWLAVVVAVNVVLALAYYLPIVARLYARPVAVPEPSGPHSGDPPSTAPRDAPAISAVTISIGTAAVLFVATGAAIVVGFVPQWGFDLAELVGSAG